MSVFDPYKKPKAAKMQSPIPMAANWLMAPASSTPRTVPNTPRGGQGAVLQTPRTVATPRSPNAQSLAPRTERFTGTEEGVCIHNMPNPYVQSSHLSTFDTREMAQKFPKGVVYAYLSIPEIGKIFNASLQSEDPNLCGWSSFTALFFSEIVKYSKWNGNCYRFLKVREDQLCMFQVGNRFKCKNIQSFTKFDMRQSRQIDAGSINVILCCIGNGQSPIFDVSHSSPNPNEGEVIMLPFLDLRIEAILNNDIGETPVVVCRPVLGETPRGVHLMIRADDFERSDMKELQNSVLTLHHNNEIPSNLPGPVYFESKNISSQFVKHCEDSLEWKIVVSDECISFLNELLECLNGKTISCVIYNPNQQNLNYLKQHPLVCRIASTLSEVLQFIMEPTTFTPRIIPISSL